jgi:hypothetical protein
MFLLGTETTKNIYKNQKIDTSKFAAKYGMYFHTEKEGIFFMDRGQFQKTIPFTKVLNAIQKLTENSYPKVLSSMKFNNVFFNFGENDKVSKDRMLILLQCPITSGMI